MRQGNDQLRIIGGQLRGRKIKAPAGQSTRPTANRIRESVFNILSMRLCDAQVLDLFAGSGALGIEALSRGAKNALLVDCDLKAVNIISTNIQELALQEDAKVLSGEAKDIIGRLSRDHLHFDIIFLDPPYEGSVLSDTLQQLAQSDILADDGIIYAEYALENPPPDIEGLLATDHRRYGKTGVTFYKTCE